jgi:hypothetical protein
MPGDFVLVGPVAGKMGKLSAPLNTTVPPFHDIFRRSASRARRRSFYISRSISTQDIRHPVLVPLSLKF